MTTNPLTRTHKASGWTRTPLGHGQWRIEPTDDSGPRQVAFMGAYCWQNYPNDRKEDETKDRIVLIQGEPLPPWALDWLTAANAKSCASARRALRAALDDADWNEDRRTVGDD